MKKLLTLLMAAGLHYIAPAQNIMQVEYFLDVDAGVGRNALVTVTPGADGSFTIPVVTAGSTPGYHQLYLRTRDENGQWSLTTRRFVELLPAETNKQLVGGEYFFDQDPGVAKAAAVTATTPDSLFSQAVTALTGSLTPGYHILYSRFRDDYGSWSLTARRLIEAVKSTDSLYIVSAEYFMKTDPGFGNGTAIKIVPPATNVSVPLALSAVQNSTFSDTLFMRAKDSSAGNWSLTSWVLVQIALPLEFLSFTALKQDQSVLLNWTTAREVNTGHFNVQRSLDGSSFTTIGKVPARANPLWHNSYSYADSIAALKAHTLYYRLQETDKDGKTTYSDVAAVNIAQEKASFTIMPNPASTYVTVRAGSNTDAAQATITLSDAGGRILIRERMSATGTQRISLSSFGKGLYTITIAVPGNIETRKLLIQ